MINLTNILSPEELLCIREWIKKFQSLNENYALYGTGKITNEILAHIEELDLLPPSFIIDHVQNQKSYYKISFRLLSSLGKCEATNIILATNTYAKEMKDKLKKHSLKARIIDFSHIKKLKIAEKQKESQGKLKSILLRIYRIHCEHGKYAFLGTSEFARQLIKALKKHKLPLPVFVISENPSIKNFEDIPVISEKKACKAKFNVAIAAFLDKYINKECVYCSEVSKHKKVLDISDPEVLKLYSYNPLNNSKLPCVIDYSLSLGLTRKCNSACKYCVHSDSKRTFPENDFESVVKILKDAEGHVSYVSLTEIGEPLMYKKLYDVIKEAKKRIPIVKINTNGISLSLERSLKLAEAGLSHLHLSLDSLNYEYNRQTRGIDTEKILKNIEQYSKLTGLPVIIQTVITKENCDSFPELPLLKESKIPTLKQIVLLPVKDLSSQSKKNIKDICSWKRSDIEPALEIFKENCSRMGISYLIGANLHPSLKNKTRPFCNQPWRMIFVSVNNLLVPCCCFLEREKDGAVNVDLRKNNLIDAFNGKEMQKLRKSFIDGDLFDLCAECPDSIER